VGQTCGLRAGFPTGLWPGENLVVAGALSCLTFYRRRLPHWQPNGESLFLTWRLHGTLPPNRYIGPQGLTTGQAFVCIDRILDQAACGPTWLRRDDVAQMVVGSLQFGEQKLEYYRLHAWVVMANHVHVLLTPLVAVSKLEQSVKGFTARQANRLLGRTGEQFWQRESYDRWVRDREEFERIVRYIERNPVTAGLVSRVEEYRWSSAHRNPA
jgi:REP element-mobilizing transposase RayT